MGLGMFKGCSCSPYAVPNSNPNPMVFSILKEERVGKYLILMVKYPDCTNFEGRKILVFQCAASSKILLKSKGHRLDPHFSDDVNDKFPVFARFPPTEDGWQTAIDMCLNV